jgi:energy-coupling factor transporter ATP-binding protein EcfA2
MTIARWRPSRAGILNVYQYEDETLHFAGGRLLLRGVNGSGKSTAMNMLLPFLLEADTRKIDAAGERTGVLRSWMLADTDEKQRTGYLWIEFARADPDAPGGPRHHTVGCGIRANRSTDRVTLWWFSTTSSRLTQPVVDRLKERGTSRRSRTAQPAAWRRVRM